MADMQILSKNSQQHQQSLLTERAVMVVVGPQAADGFGGDSQRPREQWQEKKGRKKNYRPDGWIKDSPPGARDIQAKTGVADARERLDPFEARPSLLAQSKAGQW